MRLREKLLVSFLAVGLIPFAVVAVVARINKSVSEMDIVIQNIAASAEESTASSEQLSAQSESVSAMVVYLHTVAGNANLDEGRRSQLRIIKTEVDTTPIEDNRTMKKSA